MHESGLTQTSKASVLLFWDYDTQWGGDRVRSSKGPIDVAHEFANTERLLEMMAAYGMKSCFAVVGSAAIAGNRPYHDPAQIRAMHSAGHEVGSHTHRHEWIPGLNRTSLRETLQSSKDVLEQCIGAEVTCLVPPYNQPFDYPAGFSISLSERRAVPKERTDLRALCDMLKETGYQFCRVGYRPLSSRIMDRLQGEKFHPSVVERIGGILCLRTSVCGFAENAMTTLQKCLKTKQSLVIYGHPHSLSSRTNPQRFELLENFLKQVRDLRDEGKIDCLLPRDIVARQKNL